MKFLIFSPCDQQINLCSCQYDRKYHKPSINSHTRQNAANQFRCYFAQTPSLCDPHSYWTDLYDQCRQYTKRFRQHHCTQKRMPFKKVPLFSVFRIFFHLSRLLRWLPAYFPLFRTAFHAFPHIINMISFRILRRRRFADQEFWFSAFHLLLSSIYHQFDWMSIYFYCFSINIYRFTIFCTSSSLLHHKKSCT